MAESAGAAGCEAWIADLGLLNRAHEALLDAAEQARAAAFARPQDRSRFVLGAALLKLVVATAAGVSADDVVVDRTCDECTRQHGRPRLPGLDMHVSVAHSGAVVAAALSRLGPVGIDVEERTGAPDPALVRRVLAPAESIDSAPDFLTYWCRKESAVKATGEGLRVPLTEVVVTSPDEPPSLVSYRGEPLPAAMFDLELGPDYASALTVLTAERVRLRVERADALLQP